MIDLLIKDLDKEMTVAKTEEKDAQCDYEQMMKTQRTSAPRIRSHSQTRRKPWPTWSLPWKRTLKLRSPIPKNWEPRSSTSNRSTTNVIGCCSTLKSVKRQGPARSMHLARRKLC